MLDVDLSPDVTSCGLNMPSPDLLTPERAAAFIWTWAPGHPFTPSVSASLLSSITYRLKQLLGLADDKQVIGGSLPVALIELEQAKAWAQTPILHVALM